MNEASNRIRLGSMIILILAGLLLLTSLFVPIWRIELAAPQYPEGLALLIFANKLGGNVEIINGLNHYIGMKTLHAEDFIEFTVLPFLIGFYALFSLAAGLLRRKKIVYLLFTCFVIFGIVAMADFWRWEYNYGHNLDPNAAIIVPGMAYQPPLIGFKQLLNFGAYSIPDLGGWLFILSGCLMAFVVIVEAGWIKRRTRTTLTTGVLLVMMMTSMSCSDQKPEPVKLNRDHCDYCKMTISHGKFAAELKTSKGRVYKFDDLICMADYVKENPDVRNATFFVADFESNNVLIPAEGASFLKSDQIQSPMGGHMAAFKSADAASSQQGRLMAQTLTWKEILP